MGIVESHLIPGIGRVSDGCWWLNHWVSETQYRMSCTVTVEWFLRYNWNVNVFRCVLSGAYIKVYPDWTCGIVGSQHPTRGFIFLPKILEAILQPMGLQPLSMDSRSNATPEGFEPLTTSSKSNSPTKGAPTIDYGSQEQSITWGGFEPLTKSSRSNSSTNCTLWQHIRVACREWSNIIVKILNRAQFCEKYKFLP